MLGIIDYGMGNLGSVTNACRFLELDARIVTQPGELDACSGIILPGVGAFGDCMEHLNEHGFSDAIRSAVADGKPYLGMCLGLQVLFRESEESPGAEGLGILPGTVKRFQRPAEYKIPQIGWNGVRQVKPECALFESVDDGAFFYFVHSYCVEPSDSDLVSGVTDYGGEYCSAVWRDNVMAVQFHPEKSQKDGLQMLRNFGSLFGGEGAV